MKFGIEEEWTIDVDPLSPSAPFPPPLSKGDKQLIHSTPAPQLTRLQGAEELGTLSPP